MIINPLLELLSRLTPETRSELVTLLGQLANLVATFEPDTRTALLELLNPTPMAADSKESKIPKVLMPDFKPPIVKHQPLLRRRYNFSDAEIIKIFETWIDVNSRRTITHSEFVRLNYPNLTDGIVFSVLCGSGPRYAPFRTRYEEFFVKPGKPWVKNVKAPDPERDRPSEVVKSFADMQLNH